jgi:thiamine pyrophosphokinase
MNILLVANGKVNNKVLSNQFINKNQIDKVIAVNGGSNKLVKLNILPDLIIGDLDSKKIRKFKKNLSNILKPKVISFPKEKDFSDLELAINYINNLDSIVNKIFCFGVIGNRLDHTLANINSLFNLYLKESVKNVIIYDMESVLFLIKDRQEIKLEVDVNIRASVLAFDIPASKAYLNGFKYEGEYEILFLSSLGISNYTKSNIITVKSYLGRLAFILYSFKYNLISI